MKKQGILKKKRLHLLKRHLYQNGKVENMPVVASHLVQEQMKIGVLIFSIIDSMHSTPFLICNRNFSQLDGIGRQLAKYDTTENLSRP